MSIPKLMAVGGLADRLAVVTGNAPAYHARQIRGLIRAGALKPATYGGEGQTAAALFDEAGLCRTMIVHALASLNLEFDLLAVAAATTSNLDPDVRRAGVMEPAEALPLAIARIRKGEKMYFHVAFPEWPYDELFGDVRGRITNKPEVDDVAYDIDGNEALPIIPARAWIVLPLHRLLKPLLESGE
jgi:hypothetical protein